MTCGTRDAAPGTFELGGIYRSLWHELVIGA